MGGIERVTYIGVLLMTAIASMWFAAAALKNLSKYLYRSRESGVVFEEDPVNAFARLGAEKPDSSQAALIYRATYHDTVIPSVSTLLPRQDVGRGSRFPNVDPPSGRE